MLARTLKPRFPAQFFSCIFWLAGAGIVAIVFSVRDCFVASEMANHENPETITVLLESCLFLLLANLALISAACVAALRSYGMLVRKIAAGRESRSTPS